jgi:hypothetical protein
MYAAFRHSKLCTIERKHETYALNISVQVDWFMLGEVYQAAKVGAAISNPKILAAQLQAPAMANPPLVLGIIPPCKETPAQSLRALEFDWNCLPIREVPNPQNHPLSIPFASWDHCQRKQLVLHQLQQNGKTSYRRLYQISDETRLIMLFQSHIYTMHSSAYQW